MNNKKEKTKGREQEQIVVVQQIYIYWTKISRGSPGALRRNSVPEAFSLSIEVLREDRPYAGNIYHLVSVSEQNSFQPKSEYTIQRDLELRYGCVTVEHKEDTVMAVFRYNGTYGGAPARDPKPQTFVIKSNSWAQIMENGRFSDEHSWSYQKVVTNIGLFTNVTCDVFTKNKPHMSFQSIEELW